MRKYGDRKTTRIMMATVPHVTAWAGRTKYHVDGFLFNWVYMVAYMIIHTYYFQLFCKWFCMIFNNVCTTIVYSIFKIKYVIETL